MKRREWPYPKTEPMKAPPAESVAKRTRQTAGVAGTRALVGGLEETWGGGGGGVMSSESAVAMAELRCVLLERRYLRVCVCALSMLSFAACRVPKWRRFGCSPAFTLFSPNNATHSTHSRPNLNNRLFLCLFGVLYFVCPQCGQKS